MLLFGCTFPSVSFKRTPPELTVGVGDEEASPVGKIDDDEEEEEEVDPSSSLILLSDKTSVIFTLKNAGDLEAK